MSTLTGPSATACQRFSSENFLWYLFFKTWRWRIELCTAYPQYPCKNCHWICRWNEDNLTQEWKDVVSKNTYLLFMKIAIGPYKKLLVFANSSGRRSYFIFRRSHVQISYQRLAGCPDRHISWFSPVSSGKCKVVPQIMPQLLPVTSVQIHHAAVMIKFECI